MKDNISNKEYKDYLQTISFKASIYRRFFYFPKLNKHLKGNILEVGCGIGGFLSYNKYVVGVDINPELIEVCLNKNLNAMTMKIDELPFDDNLFDSVLLDNVLEHVETPDKIILEIRRVLKKNGTILISVPGERGYKHDKDHIVFYDEAFLNQLMIDKNFKIVNNFYTPFKSKYLDKHMRQYCLHGVFKKK